MKIIGLTPYGCILEASIDEMIRLGGPQTKAHQVVGTQFNVSGAFMHMHRLNERRQQAMQGAAYLRALADQLEQGIPQFCSVPTEEAN